jgi:hypothetical protein
VFEKINITRIVAAHISTFHDFGTRRAKVLDFVLFGGVPSALAGFAAYRGFRFNVNAVNGLLTAFAIFAGLLFNLLVMVLTFLQATPGGSSEKKIATRRELLRQITANLSFAILISVVIVTIAICGLAAVPANTDQISMTMSTVLLWGAVNFGLTLLMILTRMYALMMNDLDQHRLNKAA